MSHHMAQQLQAAPVIKPPFITVDLPVPRHFTDVFRYHAMRLVVFMAESSMLATCQFPISVSCKRYSRCLRYLPLVSLGSRFRRREMAPQPDPSTTIRVRGSPVGVWVSASCHDKQQVDGPSDTLLTAKLRTGAPVGQRTGAVMSGARSCKMVTLSDTDHPFACRCHRCRLYSWTVSFAAWQAKSR